VYFYAATDDVRVQLNETLKQIYDNGSRMGYYHVFVDKIISADVYLFHLNISGKGHEPLTCR